MRITPAGVRRSIARLRGARRVCPSHTALPIIALGISSLAVPASGNAQGQQPGTDGLDRPTATATRRTARIEIDGRPDEPAWRVAAPHERFIARLPVEGMRPSQHTAVRLLYDDDALYVAAWLRDTNPEAIAAPVARRDNRLPADAFEVHIDADGRRMSASAFRVTASGAQADWSISDRATTDDAWDAVWASAVSRDAGGWYVELRIPHGQLRPRTGADAGTWGINFVRRIARTNEELHWSLVPRRAATTIPHFGALLGVALARPPRGLEVVPFVVTRLVRGPETAADAFPTAERTVTDVSLGGDVRYQSSAGARVSVSLNPDFGQVEADPSQVNLTAFEPFLAERRPFFVDGTDLFQLPTSDWFDDGELFYSRRIGRAPQGEVPAHVDRRAVPTATTVLAAARATVPLSSGWTGSVLGAATDQERVVARPDGDPRTVVVEPATGYAVARLQRAVRGGGTVFGVVTTSVVRRGAGDGGLGHLRGAAHAGGIDLRHRFGQDDAYEVRGFLYGSHVVGSPQAIAATQRSSARYFQRPDAAHLGLDTTRTSLAGAAAFLKVGKYGGTWRWQGAMRAFSPEFEINDLGFQPAVDRVVQFANVGYEGNARDDRPLRTWWAYLNQWTYGTMGGEYLHGQVQADAFAELRNWWTVRGRLSYVSAGSSVDALRGGPALWTPGRMTTDITVASDARRTWAGTLRGVVARDADGAGGRTVLTPSVTFRPGSRVAASLAGSIEGVRYAWQHVATRALPTDTAYVLGSLRQRTAALTGRLDVAVSPTATLQVYAHPFLSVGTYDALWEVVDPRRRRSSGRVIRLSHAVPGEPTGPDHGQIVVDRDADGTADYRLPDPHFVRRELNGTAVFRWEYRPGSALFVVWTQQRDASVDGADAPHDGLVLRRDASALGRAPTTNVLLVKLSRWIGF